MNRTFTKLLVLALLVVTAVSGCVKNSDVLTINKTNLIGTYTIVSEKAKATGAAEQDVTSKYYEPCEMDDQVTLNSDLTATYIDAGTKCSSNIGGTDTWDLNGNIFTISGEDYTIISLTRSTLVYSQTVTVSGIDITTTWTYRRY
jgi:hypothetical protein